MLIAALVLVALFLAYFNGANDNFKGVATLYGSGTMGYRSALSWATFTTFAGSICSFFLAKGLVARFSGNGIVPAAIAASPEFIISVAAGAALTVLVATNIGFPVSTTHAIVGALVGSGFVAVGEQVNIAALGMGVFLPLITSPIIAFAFAIAAYAVLHAVREQLGIEKEMCVCAGSAPQLVPLVVPQGVLSMATVSQGSGQKIEVAVNTQEYCEERYAGTMMGVSVQKMMDSVHVLSAGLVSFARGLNDTPKMIALLLVAGVLDMRWSAAVIGLAIALGGLLSARKVATTMSKKISAFGHGPGLTGQLVTSSVVIIASLFGLPVSTTHVSVGAIAGIGAPRKAMNKAMVTQIVLAWVITLPAAAILSGMGYYCITHFAK